MNVRWPIPGWGENITLLALLLPPHYNLSSIFIIKIGVVQCSQPNYEKAFSNHLFFLQQIVAKTKLKWRNDNANDKRTNELLSFVMQSLM